MNKLLRGISVPWRSSELTEEALAELRLRGKRLGGLRVGGRS